MSGQWTCAICGGPVERTPTGRACRHNMWRVGVEGIRQTDERCPGTGAVPPVYEPRDTGALVAELVAERFGAPRGSAPKGDAA